MLSFSNVIEIKSILPFKEIRNSRCFKFRREKDNRKKIIKLNITLFLQCDSKKVYKLIRYDK